MAATAGRKRPAPEPDPEPDADPDTPQILRLTTDGESPEKARADALAAAERTPVFTIDDTLHTAPKRPPFWVGVEYMHRLRTRGGMNADDWLLDVMLGAEGAGALRGYARLTPQQLAQVLAELGLRALGPAEQAAPKDSAGE
jgi:hypothetical protein